MKVPILRILCALVKICQIPHVIFQTTSQFFFKFCMTLQCHEIYSFVLFQVKCCILSTKGTNQSANVAGFLVLRSKFTKFLSCLKQKIIFSSYFAPFSQCALECQPAPPQKHHPLFLAKHPLNGQTVQAPLFKQSPSLYWFFLNPSKSRIFQ